MFKGSWKTTLAGIAAILGVVVKGVNDPTTISPEDIALALAGGGLIFARDNNKTSEDVKVKE